MAKVRFVGIDVSAKWLDVCAGENEEAAASSRFDNDAEGHRKLLRWIGKRGWESRVVLEATGVYSLDLAMALHRSKRVEVMVANPRAVKDFAGASQQRARTDETSAIVLREFAERMPFVSWNPPRPVVLEVRALSRRMVALTDLKRQEKNRLHAHEASSEMPACVRRDLEVNIRHLERRIALLLDQALRLIAGDEEVHKAYGHLTSIKGIAKSSAVQILGEILTLPRDLTVRQWVAYAGLDPRPIRSGSSIDRRVRISKVGNANLRRALFMPAVVAKKWEPQIAAFSAKLLARGKSPLVVTIAVMRKLLHAIYGMLRTDSDFIGSKFYAKKAAATA